MKRTLLYFLTLIALGLMAGCSSSGNTIGGGSGSTPSPALLNGQYGILLSGYDSGLHALTMAGTITADGKGHINAGSIDLNDNGTISSNAALSGSYSFDVNGGGTIGTIVLGDTVGGIPLEFGFALNSGGTFGTMIGLDSTNSVTEGTMQLQNTATFSFSSGDFAGNYIVTMNGRDQNNPTAALGRFTLSAGTTSNVSFDRSISGNATGTAGPTVGPSASAAVTFTSAPNATTGRGTMTVLLDDALLSGTQTFTYYVINATRFVAVEADANGTMLIDAAAQTIPATVNTTGSAFGIAGFDFAVSNDAAAVGQVVITGTGSNTATVALDANDDGTLSNATGILGSVAYNSATGRGTIAITGGVTDGLANTLVFYLDAPGTGFMMDATAGTTNRALSGPITAQTGVGSFLAASDIAGLAILRARGVATADAQSFVGEFGANSASTYSFLFDQRVAISSTTFQTTVDNISGSASLVTAINTGTGRGELLIPGTPSETLVFYVIGPNQFVMMDISPLGVGNPSSVFYATPD